MSGCKGGMTQYTVEAILRSVLFEMVNDGTLQAGLKQCDAQCNDFLGKGTQVVTCSQLPDQLCAALQDNLTCLPFVETFLLVGKTLKLTLTDGQVLEVPLASLAGSDVVVSAYDFINGDTLRITQSDGNTFSVNVGTLKLTATDVTNFITNNSGVRTAVANVFSDCDNVPHTPGARIPTCNQMTTTVNNAVTSGFNTLGKYLESAMFNDIDNTLKLTVKNGSVFTIPLTSPANVTLGVEPAVNPDNDVPTDSIGQDTYLLAKPHAWEKRMYNGVEYSTPLYII